MSTMSHSSTDESYEHVLRSRETRRAWLLGDLVQGTVAIIRMVLWLSWGLKPSKESATIKVNVQCWYQCFIDRQNEWDGGEKGAKGPFSPSAHERVRSQWSQWSIDRQIKTRMQLKKCTQHIHNVNDVMRVWMTGNSLPNTPDEKTCGIFYITQNKYDTCNIQHTSTPKQTKYPRFHKHVQLDFKIAWSSLDLKWGEYGTKYVVHHGATKTASKKLLVTLKATCTYLYALVRTCTYKYVRVKINAITTV